MIYFIHFLSFSQAHCSSAIRDFYVNRYRTSRYTKCPVMSVTCLNIQLSNRFKCSKNSIFVITIAAIRNISQPLKKVFVSIEILSVYLLMRILQTRIVILYENYDIYHLRTIQPTKKTRFNVKRSENHPIRSVLSVLFIAICNK